MKTVLVTGASGEIGAAIAKEFAAAGYALALHGAKHIENVNSTCRNFQIKRHRSLSRLRRPFRPRRMRARVGGHRKKTRHIDALVNAAGISLVDFSTP